MSAAAWSAVADMMLAVGAGVAAFWAVFTYRKAKRSEASRWMRELHTEFYTSAELLEARELIEYACATELDLIFRLRVLDRHVVLSEVERERLRQADRVLNFFEQILYLEEEGHIRKGDRDVFFEYWFGILADRDKASLRRYLARCGYERLSRMLHLPHDEHVVIADEQAAELEGLEPVGSAPEGRVFRVLDGRVIRKLDERAGFDPEDRQRVKVDRVLLHLPELAVDAWHWSGSAR